MASPSPSPQDLATSASPARRMTAHDLQISFFLEMIEDIGIGDDGIVEDILDGYPNALPMDGEIVENCDSNVNEDEDNISNEDSGEYEVDLSSLDEFADEQAHAWTKLEIMHMKRFLKEHGMAPWINEYVKVRNQPIPKLLYAFDICLCKELRVKPPKTLLVLLQVALSRELRLRDKLTAYNTVDDAIDLIRRSQRILVLTGAGISVSCGIPDFRSPNGLYASLKDKGEYDLSEPQEMFDINYFRENPAVFYSFASQIYPSNFVPSPCHRFIKLIEDRGQLLRNYTQNIDTLETAAGVQKVLQCHGSFATASCCNCKHRVIGTEIEEDIMQHRVPLCKVCNTKSPAMPKKKSKKKKRKTKSGWDSDESDEPDKPSYPPGIMKPDITFFHEKVTDDFDRAIEADREKVDLLLVIGTSLKVAPVGDIVYHIPHSVPQILINKTPVHHTNPDIILLGNADDIITHICTELDWKLPSPPSKHLATPDGHRNMRKRPSGDMLDRAVPERVGNSHVWLFNGAEGGRWVEDVAQKSLHAPSKPALTRTDTSTSIDREFKKARVQ